MDEIEDQDGLPSWIMGSDPGVITNIATSLYACSGLALNELTSRGVDDGIVVELFGEFNRIILMICD